MLIYAMIVIAAGKSTQRSSRMQMEGSKNPLALICSVYSIPSRLIGGAEDEAAWFL